MTRLFRTVRSALAALMITGAASMAAALQPFPPDGTAIREVVIEGTDRTDPRNIRRVMELSEGDVFLREAQRRDMQAIAGLGTYNPLTLRMSTEDVEGGVRLVVRVDENPVVRRISFTGNVKYSEERLKSQLDFEEGEILPLAAKATTQRVLREYYADGGYKTTRIRMTVTPVEDGEADVSIVVDEGEKIRIKDLDITGNSAIPDWRIKLAVSNSGSWLFFNNHYDDRAFEDDLRTIEAMYRERGYLDAVARRGDFEWNREEAEVTPEIVVEEGPRYRIADITVAGNTLFTDAEISEYFRPLIGEWYDGKDFRESLSDVYRLYGDQGYIDAQIDGDFNKDADTGRVTLALDVTENDVVYVGQVYVRKNSYDYDFELTPLEEFIDWTSPGVTDEAVLEEVRLEPGQRFTTADQVRTEQRLRNLGFLNKVNVQRRPTTDPNINDAVIEVEQDPNAGYFSVTAGYGEVSGPALGVNYVNPDLFGDARVLKAGAIIGTRTRSFRLGYLDRHFADSENSLEVAAYRSRFRYHGYAQRTYGGWVEVGRPLSEYNTGYLRARLENVNYIRRQDEVESDLDTHGVYALRGLFVRDLRNSARWPTMGYRASGGLESGYADGFLAKLLASFEWYKALDDREDWVYAFETNYGLMPVDADQVGLSERFFIGGRGTVRGFEVHGIGPEDDGYDRMKTGGATMLTVRNELRHRFTDFFAARLFVDAGTLEEQPLHIGSPRVGAGGGVMFDVGAILITADLAAPVVKRDDDHEQYFSFSIDSNF